MGLLDFVKNQFIEVIEWTDSAAGTIVYRFPDKDKEIKMGAQLIVRESQAAVFVNEGLVADVFEPGRYTLATENMPVMTKLKSWKYGFNSPFKAEVYFVNLKQFTDQKWGTTNPIMMRDAEFGMLRLRAFGIFSFRVSDPTVFLREIFGTDRIYDTESIIGQLKRMLVSGISDLLGEMKIPALDLAMNYDELGVQAKDRLQLRFAGLGLQLASLYIENISLPEEVEKALDRRTTMGVLGNMQQYAQYQTAEAIRDAAQNQGGGIAGAGVGLGAGTAIGQMMSRSFGGAEPSSPPPPQPPLQSPPQPSSPQPPLQVDTVLCPYCSIRLPAGYKFCSSCGKPAVQAKVKCVKCGIEIGKGVKFCPECGAQQIQESCACKKCGAKIDTGVKFCPECGTKAD